MQDKISTSAITLFNEYGDNFTFDQLCKKCTMSRATLYRRIGSKNKLLKKLAKDGLIKFTEKNNIKERIFDAVRIVTSNNGFTNCTMDQIAKQANIGIATLYRHFPEKDKLLYEHVAKLKAEFSIEFNFDVAVGLQPGLEDIVAGMLGFISKNQDFVKILFFGAPIEQRYVRSIRDANTNNKSTFSKLVEHLKKYQKEGQISNAIKVEDMVANLIAQILHFSITAPVHFKRPLNVEQDSKTIAQIFCNGVCLANNKDNKL